MKALFLFIFVLVLIGDFLKYRNPPNFPPGPLALPFVGSFFSVYKNHPYIYLTKVKLNTQGGLTLQGLKALRIKDQKR